MRKYLKKGCVLCMALIVVLGSMTAAFAATSGGESSGTPTTPTKELGDFEVTGYEIKIAGVDKEINSITKGSEVDITLKMKYKPRWRKFCISSHC